MSWGWKITILYVSFIVGIMTLVFKANSRDVQLVRTDYYQQELLYTQRMKAIEAANALSQQVSFIVTDAGISFQFPQEFANTNLSGKIKLYRPDNVSDDREFDLKPDQNLTQLITPQSVKTGYYIAQISWNMNGVEYYFEKSVYMK